VTTLVPVLGDQLSLDIASLRGLDPASTTVLMMEVAEEATHVRHHKAKIAFILSAMRHHAQALRRAGWSVDYVALDDPSNAHGFTGEVARAAKRHGAAAIRSVEGSDWRVLGMQRGWAAATGLTVELIEDDRFFAAKDDFAAFADGRRQLVMEYFYRRLRQATGLLMDGAAPAGGRWNFDAHNRKAPPRGRAWPGPPARDPTPIELEVEALVAARFGDHFGRLGLHRFPVTRAQALDALDDFLDRRLADFGDFQDAMARGEPWLNHSILSPPLNVGLLSPRELCAGAEAAWRAGRAPLNAAEGFIRQILGWREYVRGLYWWAGPDYRGQNALDATRPLPAFFWTGETRMACLADAIGQTRDHAYAHHIQRLMLIGNFAMLAGCSPQEVSDWFLVVYADAYPWVEEPNVIGMSQWADGGLMATKPYAGGGNYINKMSDYCRGCHYDVKARVGVRACPFNALYWDFLARNRAMLGGNHRLLRVYHTWDRMGDAARAETRAQAAAFLATLEPAAPGWARGAP
jgi:deoxyribodipyrimidine photolyase-related protein